MIMMRNIAALLPAVALALMVVATAPAMAQEPQAPPAEQKAPATISLEGELVRVDADTKILVVKPSEGKEVEFKYTDTTDVTGAQGGAAGLATMKEGRVTVHYTEDAKTKDKTAVRIVVAPKA